MRWKKNISAFRTLLIVSWWETVVHRPRIIFVCAILLIDMCSKLIMLKFFFFSLFHQTFFQSSYAKCVRLFTFELLSINIHQFQFYLQFRRRRHSPSSIHANNKLERVHKSELKEDEMWNWMQFIHMKLWSVTWCQTIQYCKCCMRDPSNEAKKERKKHR